MTLPEVTIPPPLRRFLAEGHGFQPQAVFADTAMRTGHARRRRVYTTAPRVQSVSLLLDEAQMAAFDAWFESALLAGERQFAALVADEQGLRTWWAARWLEPYAAEPIPPGYWRVTGQLLLTGEASLTPPVDTGFAAEIEVVVTGRAALTVPTLLAAEIDVPVTGVVGQTLFATEIEVAVTGKVADLVERQAEDGQQRITEDGQARLTED